MACLVIDEWLFADLGSANPATRLQAYRFVLAIYQKCDQIVIVRDSPFFHKALSLWSRTNWAPQEIARDFHYKFTTNALKGVQLEYSDLPELSPELERDVEPSDRYLVAAQKYVGATLVVTSDGDLLEALRAHGIACELRETFVPDYIAKYGKKKA